MWRAEKVLFISRSGYKYEISAFCVNKEILGIFIIHEMGVWRCARVGKQRNFATGETDCSTELTLNVK